jgi:hypothetical protein
MQEQAPKTSSAVEMLKFYRLLPLHFSAAQSASVQGHLKAA